MTLVRLDIEGNLYAGGDPPRQQFEKRLPLGKPWNVDIPGGLHCLAAADSVVSAVETSNDQGVQTICYDASLELLNLNSLRELLYVEGPLAAWRVSKLAVDLVKHLTLLHDEGIPQLVIHPERIARRLDRFVLLPTLPNVLPSLSELPSNQIAGWLHFVAPEILRTRGRKHEALYAGDIYSLGRMLELLCQPDWQPDLNGNGLMLIERQVECCHRNARLALAEPLVPLARIIAEMCSVDPEKRPTTTALAKAFDDLRSRQSPMVRIGELLAKGRVNEAERCVADFEAANRVDVFGRWDRDVHLMKSDVFLAIRPPKCREALNELAQAESSEYYEVDVRHRMGRAYELYTDAPDHLRQSSDHYRQAAIFRIYTLTTELREEQDSYRERHHGATSDEQLQAALTRLEAERRETWQNDLLDRILGDWARVLDRFEDPTEVLNVTDVIEIRDRNRQLVEARTNAWLRRREIFLDAWIESTIALARFGYDTNLFNLVKRIGQRIAEQLDPLDLMRWMQDHLDKEEFAAAIAIAWDVNGNEDEARKWEEKAKAQCSR
jgi:hypothetical protein